MNHHHINMVNNSFQFKRLHLWSLIINPLILTVAKSALAILVKYFMLKHIPCLQPIDKLYFQNTGP